MNIRENLENQDYPEWLPQRMVLLAKTGSNLYGTSLTPEEDPENKGSDIDYCNKINQWLIQINERALNEDWEG